MTIHRVSIQLRRPTGPDDPGAAEWCSYIIEGETVVLADRDGKPLERQSTTRRRGEPAALTRWERRLRPGEDHLRAAKELLLARYTATKRGSDFNRPIRCPPIGIA